MDTSEDTSMPSFSPPPQAQLGVSQPVFAQPEQLIIPTDEFVQSVPIASGALPYVRHIKVQPAVAIVSEPDVIARGALLMAATERVAEAATTTITSRYQRIATMIYTRLQAAVASVRARLLQ